MSCSPLFVKLSTRAMTHLLCPNIAQLQESMKKLINLKRGIQFLKLNFDLESWNFKKVWCKTNTSFKELLYHLDGFINRLKLIKLYFTSSSFIKRLVHSQEHLLSLIFLQVQLLPRHQSGRSRTTLSWSGRSNPQERRWPEPRLQRSPRTSVSGPGATDLFILAGMDLNLEAN